MPSRTKRIKLKDGEMINPGDMDSCAEGVSDCIQRPREATNEDLINEFIKWGNPMKQMWVLHAIQQYAKDCITHKEQLLKDMEHAPVYGPSWIGCAEEWVRHCKENNRSTY